MALTITFDGTGVLAYADSATSDTGGGAWGELGAGTVSLNPDVYIYGNSSFASKYASKAGRTYYDYGSGVNFSTNGELCYMWINIQSNGAFTLYNDGGTFNGPFNILIGNSTSNLRHWNIASKGESNGWTGGWKSFVIDPVNITTGTETEGTAPNGTNESIFGVWIDTDVSVRAESIFQSMIIAAKGAIITGSPTSTGDAFNELVLWCNDLTTAPPNGRAFPLLEYRGTTYFQKGGITIGDGSTSTSFTATGNTIECEESSYYNGSAWVSSYPSDANYITTTANASLTFTNVNYAGYVDNKLQWDTSLGNASTVTGGSIRKVGSWTVKSTDTFDGVVFGDMPTTSLGAATYDNCSFIDCGTLTVSSTLSFDNNTVNNSATNTCLVCSDLDQITGGKITGNGGYGVELTTASDASWTTQTSGFRVGATGEPITPYYEGSTANGTETLFINIASGTVNIAVSGVDTPSVALPSGSTATINITGFKPTLTLTGIIAESAANIAGGAESSEVRIYEHGNWQNELTGIEDVVETTGGSKIGTFTYQYAYAANTFVDIVIHHQDYKYYTVLNYELGSGNASLPIAQIFDRNYSDPA